MNYEDIVACGISGCSVSAVGVATSTTEVQAIISIIITVLGFIISVLIPTVLKIVKKVQEIKADGKVEIEEVEELVKEVENGTKEVIKGAEEVIEEINKER